MDAAAKADSHINVKLAAQKPAGMTQCQLQVSYICVASEDGYVRAQALLSLCSPVQHDCQRCGIREHHTPQLLQEVLAISIYSLPLMGALQAAELPQYASQREKVQLAMYLLAKALCSA